MGIEGEGGKSRTRARKREEGELREEDWRRGIKGRRKGEWRLKELWRKMGIKG